MPKILQEAPERCVKIGRLYGMAQTLTVLPRRPGPPSATKAARLAAAAHKKNLYRSARDLVRQHAPRPENLRSRSILTASCGDISTRIAKIRVGPVPLVRRDEGVAWRKSGSANLCSESADTDLVCQQDG